MKRVIERKGTNFVKKETITTREEGVTITTGNRLGGKSITKRGGAVEKKRTVDLGIGHITVGDRLPRVAGDTIGVLLILKGSVEEDQDGK